MTRERVEDVREEQGAPEASAQSWPLRLFTALFGPWTRENLFSWLRLIVLLMFIKGCLIDQYSVPTGSMEPTIHGAHNFFLNDRLLVNKWLFGPRIPFTTIRLWKWGEPKRWDIVVFHAVEGSSDHDILVKRVAGLPGERVRIQEGQLWVNGEPVPFPDSMPEDMYYTSDMDIIRMIALAPPGEERERLKMLRAKYPYRYGGLEDEEFSVVPEGHYFLLGDNSLNSVDGRVWGWVPHENLYGRAVGVWWPFTRMRDFTGWTDQWWGMLLLYGLPLGLVAFELVPTVRARHAREAGVPSKS